MNIKMAVFIVIQ